MTQNADSVLRCAVCGDPIQRTIQRPQYGTNPSAPYPRGVGQRPFVHSDYRKNYDHQATQNDSSGTCRVCGAPAGEPHGESQDPETKQWSITCSDEDRDGVQNSSEAIKLVDAIDPERGLLAFLRDQQEAPNED